jgi:two-component system chemotaxis sensor kinase CheA
MSDETEIIREFLVESHENLDQLDREFVALESDPGARERIAAIFRTIHTIKGTAGFLGFQHLESLTHAGETLLCRVRDGKLTLDAHITSELLRMVDAVRGMLTHIEGHSTDGDDNHDELISSLSQLVAKSGDGTNIRKPIVKADPAQLLPSDGLPPDAPRFTPDRRSDQPESSPAASRARMPPAAGVAAGSVSGTPAPAPAMLAALRPPTRILTTSMPPESVSSVRPWNSVLPRTLRPGDEASGQAESHQSVSDGSVRVDVGLLDKLMNLVGELVLARNQILQHAGLLRDSTFQSTTQRLNIITTELQEGVMKTRMQPIGNVWGKFPRVVRDLGVLLKKKVNIEMYGEDTELDRTIIEAIKDPLTHIVRNSVDHGIESAEVRASRGKPASGRLILRAFHEGGQVNIEISDDGGGIDPDRVRQHAAQRGLLSAEHARALSDREATNLIFAPGFSTAENVTNVSGRGVGMDVVKTNIEKIGGTVDVQSRVGHGTTIRIKIPLTLAIIPALVVTCGGERFAIPQVSLFELVRLKGAQIGTSLEHIHGSPVYRLRGNLLPLVYLSRALNIAEAAGNDTGVINIVVVRADDRQFGLIVEAVNDTEEIVVKPLGKELKGISAFAGATIMGDGRVALILDVLGLAQRTGVISEVRDRGPLEGTQQATALTEMRSTLLLFRVGKDGRMAMPLSLVARLEEFDPSAIEWAGGHAVVQYRAEILRLVDLREMLGGQPAQRAASEPLQVVVYSENGCSVGLIVEQILDIVDEVVSREQRVSQPGVLAAAVIQGRVTGILDAHGVIEAVHPGILSGVEAA